MRAENRNLVGHVNSLQVIEVQQESQAHPLGKFREGRFPQAQKRVGQMRSKRALTIRIGRKSIVRLRNKPEEIEDGL